nr:PREDICTED: uncharacterized protein LOC100875831 [Megachile rotundata]
MEVDILDIDMSCQKKNDINEKYFLNHLVLQSNGTRKENSSQIPCLKVFKKYLIVLGQYSYQTELSHKVIITVIVGCVMSLLIPAILQFFSSLRENDIDTAMDCIPVSVSVINSMIKILNHNIYRKKFENIFERMTRLWEIAEVNGELQILKEVIDEGSQMGTLYRSSLWIFVSLFLCIPLSSFALDIIVPLNESRPRVSLFKLNYIMDMEDHFYIVYLHSACCALNVVLIVTTMDSLYMVIIHYSCGLFALCGYQIQKVAEDMDLNSDNTRISSVKYERLKRCVKTHYEAIKFYEYMEESTRIGYLFQVGFNMIGITATAVQAVANFDRPAEAFRIVMFLCGQQFHLYALSLPGQELMDRSAGLIDAIYSSKWYQTPIKFQRVLEIMQIRCSRPCKLTAGGLYEMNIENFGSMIKTCVSYFTVLLSLRG